MYYKKEYEVIMQCYTNSRNQTLYAKLTDETRGEVLRTTKKKIKRIQQSNCMA